MLEKNGNLFDYVSSLCHLKKLTAGFSIFSRKNASNIEYFDEIGKKIDIKTSGKKHIKFISYFLPANEESKKDYFIIFNACSHDVTVKLPSTSTGKWHIVLDTALDIFDISAVVGGINLNKNELHIRATSMYISISHSVTLLSNATII